MTRAKRRGSHKSKARRPADRPANPEIMPWRLRPTTACWLQRALVSRFRSSQTLAAPSDANFGIKGDTSKLTILVWLLNLKFLYELAAVIGGTSNSPH